MDTLYYWTHRHTRTGKRVRTRHQLNEADAARTLIEPQRVEWGATVVQPLAMMPAGKWVSGLVVRHDGAMMQPKD